MKCKKLLTCLLAATMSLSGFAAFAASDDPEDTTYYTITQPKMTFDDKASSVTLTLPTTANSANTNYGTFYLQEEDGNIYWSVNRYLKSGVTGWNAGYCSPSNGALGSNTGEYVIQNKIKFANYSGGMANIGLRINHAGSRQMYFGTGSLNPSDNTADGLHFKVEWNQSVDGTTVVKNQQFDLASYAFQAETWYTFRQIINLDTMKATLEIYNGAGTELLHSVGLTLPETVVSGDYSFTVPYTNLSFAGIRADITIYQGAGVGVDDLLIAKASHKPVAVTYNAEQGTVTYNNETVASGAETPVPYNSTTPAAFSVTPKDGFEIADIKVNGESKGNAISNIEFTSVTSAQTLEVTFAEKEKVAPSIESGVVDYEFSADNDSQVAYFNINPGYGYEFTKGIAKIYEVGNAASEETPLVLESEEMMNNYVTASWDGKYGIRVKGSGLQQNKQYVLAPYWVAANGTETVTIDPIGNNENVEEYTFTFGQ